MHAEWPVGNGSVLHLPVISHVNAVYCMSLRSELLIICFVFMTSIGSILLALLSLDVYFSLRYSLPKLLYPTPVPFNPAKFT